MIEQKASIATACKGYPRDISAMDVSQIGTLACKRGTSRQSPVKAIQVLELSQIWLCFLVLAVGWGSATLLFVTEIGVYSCG